MEQNKGSIVYWTLLNHGQWKLYLAATIDGLCYAGPHNAPFEELAAWTQKRLPAYRLEEDSSVLEPYAEELIDYMEGKRKEFTMPLDLHGTPFQHSVWMALKEIPYGQTVSYSDIAARIQKPKSVRAVGTAIGANPLLITVPCHRVIGKNGNLTGFRGGLDMKKQLLALEQ
ncbi:methylated-DNA--[protein]-cysteine S-methyltransferase [Sporosarcina highlanderae]|uniref:Methylated-DNA--protein-cysteine methyltransferase n=1 Tax=Sporosarcina highlanderae TaxID=3035916 RepID=A0ABT8JMA6_9BACL|nr:methylated-DNA--[protein]-cysteine S-methyltransferase [Sporosarcina highlanderae]MDN4606293.1 methylated-DNA--[protein]-cysteine S-methyltransferase [Sporosarcina highlanderae]